jgi:integrase
MRITKRTVDQLETPLKDTFFWDDTLKGFGVKVTVTGRKVFVLQGRIDGKVRRYTIGQYGSPWSPDQARAQALSMLSELAKGIDPTAEKRARRLQGSFADLTEQYVAELIPLKKSSTQSLELTLIKRHVVPLIGRMKVGDITRRDVQKMMIDISAGKTALVEKTKSRGKARVQGGQGTANRSAAVVSAVMTYAMELSLRPDNPAKGVKKYTLKRHDRYLRNDELEQLGASLVKAEQEGVSPFSIAAIRFMILTGCRAGEALSLQWSWIDWEHGIAKLPDSKTGQKNLLLGQGALELLKPLDRVEASPLVFPSSVGGITPISIQKIWRRIRADAGLEDVRMHDLRHNFASSAVSSGQSLYVVGKLLGHSQSQTTQRYAHLAHDPVKQAADDVSVRLGNSLMGKI